MCFANAAGWQFEHVVIGMVGVWLAVAGGTP